MRTQRKSTERLYPYHDTSFGCGDGENGRCSVGGPDDGFRVDVGVLHPTIRTMPFVRDGIDAGVPDEFKPY